MTHDESIWIAAVLSQQLLRQIRADTEGQLTDPPAPVSEPSPSPNKSSDDLRQPKRTQRDEAEGPQDNTEVVQPIQPKTPLVVRTVEQTPHLPDQITREEETPREGATQERTFNEPAEKTPYIEGDEEPVPSQPLSTNPNSGKVVEVAGHARPLIQDPVRQYRPDQQQERPFVLTGESSLPPHQKDKESDHQQPPSLPPMHNRRFPVGASTNHGN